MFYCSLCFYSKQFLTNRFVNRFYDLYAVVLVTATIARGLMSSLSNKLMMKLVWCSRAQKTLRHIIQTLQNPMKK